MGKKEQVKQLTNYMANFVAHIGKVLPDDVIAKLDELAKLLSISENQLSHITNVPAGHGLIRCGGVIVPFENSFPKGTRLYRLMSTKPGETWAAQQHGGEIV